MIKNLELFYVFTQKSALNFVAQIGTVVMKNIHIESGHMFHRYGDM